MPRFATLDLLDLVNFAYDTLENGHRIFCILAAGSDLPYAARCLFKLKALHATPIQLINCDKDRWFLDICLWSCPLIGHLFNLNPAKGTAVLSSDLLFEMMQSDTVDHRSFNEKCLGLTEAIPENLNLRCSS